MFRHLLSYSCRQLFRTREVIFWTLLFPVLLATFMNMAFGKISDATEKMDTIQVALYEGKEEVALETTLQQLSQVKEGGKAFINVKKAGSMEQADQWLKEGKVHGVLCQKEKLTLKVAQNGIEQSVLRQIVNQYIHYKDTLERLARENPQKLADAMEQMKSETIGFTEKKTTEGNMDDTVSYFYAIFAMTCLFASFAGEDKMVRLQADTSVLGMRRGVAPVSKAKVILADFICCEILEYASALLVYGYMRFALGIQLGEKTGMILILLLAGTCYGTMFGFFIGALPKLTEGVKVGICVGANLMFCAMSDLMISGIRNYFAHHAPLVNHINPAALIVDSFYALNVYNTYGRFCQNLVLLMCLTLVFGILSLLFVRRKRYASV